jgi:hypothetical protein
LLPLLHTWSNFRIECEKKLFPLKVLISIEIDHFSGNDKLGFMNENYNDQCLCLGGENSFNVSPVHENNPIIFIGKVRKPTNILIKDKMMFTFHLDLENQELTFETEGFLEIYSIKGTSFRFFAGSCGSKNGTFKIKKFKMKNN